MTFSEIPIHVAGQWIVKFVVATDIPKISMYKKTSVASKNIAKPCTGVGTGFFYFPISYYLR